MTQTAQAPGVQKAFDKLGDEMSPDTKVCGYCGKEQLASEFFSVPSNKEDGLSSFCRTCFKDHRQEILTKSVRGMFAQND